MVNWQIYNFCSIPTNDDDSMQSSITVYQKCNNENLELIAH